MSFDEQINITDDTITASGTEGVAWMRICALRTYMRADLEFQQKHGSRLYRNPCPFESAKFMLDVQGDTHQDVYDNFLTMCDEMGNQGVVDRLLEVGKQREREGTERHESAPKLFGKRNDEETLDGLVTLNQVQNLLVCALEGGANYWYMIIDTKEPSDPSMIPNNDLVEFRFYRCPWGDGSITLCDADEYYENDEDETKCETWTINEKSMKNALELMRTKYKRHYVDIIAENEDGDTGDVFLQLAAFGRLVYG